jgi:hypothetical protein
MPKQLMTAAFWIVGTMLMCGAAAVAWVAYCSARRSAGRRVAEAEEDKRIQGETVRNRLDSIHESDEKQSVEERVAALEALHDRAFLQSAGIAE